jgi:hypothetical protein
MRGYTTTVVGGPTYFRTDCCPPATHCGGLGAAHQTGAKIIFAPIFKHLALPRIDPLPCLARRWHYRLREHRRKTFSNQLNNRQFRRYTMKIENLSKDLDTTAMTEVHGGIALTGQVVPTNVQDNEMLQAFNVASAAPVALGNDGDQSNYSRQDTVAPVGSLFLGSDFLRRA